MAARTHSSSYKTLQNMALVIALIGVAALVVGLTMSVNAPNPYVAEIDDLLRHNSATTFALTLGGAAISIAIIAKMVLLGVNAVVFELLAMSRRSPSDASAVADE